jgi:hypothetical protein
MAKKDDKPHVTAELYGFNIYINKFGQIERTHSIEQINKVLNKEVVDKKLKDRFGFKSDPNDETVQFLYE